MSHMAVEHEIPSMGVDNRKLGMWTFLGSEVMFFSALIVTYLVMRGRSTGGPLPTEMLDVPLTAVNTFVLLVSSLTMVTALAAIQKANPRGMRLWLIATAVLGLVFLSGQAYEFNKMFREGLSLSTNLFGATFFTLTGFHGMHVLVGVIWIGFVLARAFKGGITPTNHLAVELAGLYWHFVDIVWIIIFTLVYLL
ncbi:MAG: heme-copper oxidase subunit III [Chloroflexi bacterium]|nr:heme-copper oxidase subunit III [Chloroflexota bacterium]